MEHPKSIGDRTTLAVMLALHEAGYALLLPFGENTRYDLVIDDGVRFARVQCKTGRLRSGAVRFKTCSSYAHHPNPKLLRRDYDGQVDFLGVYCPENGAVYLIPLAVLPLRTQAALRVDPPRNSQVRGVRFAAEYEIARLGGEPTRGLRVKPGARGSCA
jgi:hypothetical protein